LYKKKTHKKADGENPFEHGKVINYTLHGVSIHPVATKIQAFFPTQLPERKETAQGFHHEADGDFKTVTEFNGCDMRNGGCINNIVLHNTNLNDIVRRRKPE
jgi:hypothetical protein